MKFEEFNLNPMILSELVKKGYESPTPIQEQTIPIILQGKDVMGLAQTGTGKTAAFALPILHRIAQSNVKGKVRALIIAPTRELVEQINDAIIEFGKRLGISSMVIYGGVGYAKQEAQLKKGVDIIVACPGRLLDHLDSRKIDLYHLETLVLDEADHMFDMGFLPTIRKILKFASQRKQTLLFSATMPSDIQALASETLNNPVKVAIKVHEKLSTINHAIYPVPQHLKTGLLFELIKQTDAKSILIFTRTKHRAKDLDKKLQQKGYKATSLQGNLSQNRRQEALEGFRKGTYQIMVATDIAARGIDVSLVSHVINYDIPGTPEAYTHRIGRTGRAERTGDAFTFVSDEDMSMVKLIERKLGETIERKKVETFNYKEIKHVTDVPVVRRPFKKSGYRGRRD
ncbi:MAG: DEAD/DEAH box helicase [Candidatus Margulisbacteria bacterium]|nr:DEAD/DEAH box helicase [Candidatus Margulisiibacteriota bacterium]